MNNIIFNPYDKLNKRRKHTFESFKKYALNGMYTADDGHGYYATDTEVSNIDLDFYDIFHNCVPKWCTHIVWYNK